MTKLQKILLDTPFFTDTKYHPKSNKKTKLKLKRDEVLGFIVFISLCAVAGSLVILLTHGIVKLIELLGVAVK